MANVGIFVHQFVFLTWVGFGALNHNKASRVNSLGHLMPAKLTHQFAAIFHVLGHEPYQLAADVVALGHS